LIQQIVLKRASNEAGVSAPKLNLRKSIALQQIEAPWTKPDDRLAAGLIASTIVLFVAGYWSSSVRR
jgi:hypothetical protein